MANFDDLVDPFDSPIPQKKTGLLRKAGDLAVGIGSGAVGATKAISDAFSADNAASKALGGVNEGLQGLLSPETVVRQYQQSRIMDEANGRGIGGQVAAGLKAFAVDPAQTIAQGAGSIAPFIAAQFVPGVGQSATAARALQLGMGVGMGAGTAKGSIFDEVKKRELAAGRTPEQAQAAADAAQSYGGANTDQIALGAGLGLADAALGATPAAVSALRRSLGKEAIEGIGKPTTDSIIKAGIKGAAGEMPVEFAQGAQEQVAANIAAQRAGYDAGTWDGAISQGTLEGLAAAGPGAGFGILNRGQAPAAEQPPAQPPVAPTTTPGAPPAATPPTDPTLGQSLTGTPMADLMGGSGLTGGANPLQAGLSTLTSNNQMYPGMNTEPTGYTVDPDTGAIIQAEPVGARQVVAPVEQVQQRDVLPPFVPEFKTELGAAPPKYGNEIDMQKPEFDTSGLRIEYPVPAITPAQRMGLNPANGPLSAAATIAANTLTGSNPAGMLGRASDPLLSGISDRRVAAENDAQRKAEEDQRRFEQARSGTLLNVPETGVTQRPLSVERGMELVKAKANGRTLLPQEDGFLVALRKEMGDDAYANMAQVAKAPFLFKKQERTAILKPNQDAIAAWDAANAALPSTSNITSSGLGVVTAPAQQSPQGTPNATQASQAQPPAPQQQGTQSAIGGVQGGANAMPVAEGLGASSAPAVQGGPIPAVQVQQGVASQVTAGSKPSKADNLAALQQKLSGQTKPTPTTPPAQTKATPAPEAGPTNQGATNGQGQETLLKAEQPTGAAAMVSGAPVADTSLNRDSSWVIREKATGNFVMETFDRAKVDALNTAKYEAVPIQQHLAEQVAKKPSDTTKPGGFTEKVRKAAGKVAPATVAAQQMAAEAPAKRNATQTADATSKPDGVAGDAASRPTTHTNPVEYVAKLNREIPAKAPDEKPTPDTLKAAASIPTFQGGKTKMARAITEKVRQYWGGNASKIDTIIDYFGGSGSWGAYMAGAAFPNVKRLVIHEFNPDRLNKIRLFNDRGGDVEKLLSVPAVKAYFDAVSSAIDKKSTFSGSAIANVVADSNSRLKLRVAARDAVGADVFDGLLQAIQDQGNASFGKYGKGKSGSDAVDDILRRTTSNARQAYAQMQSLRERGVSIEYVTGNSYEAKQTQGKNVLAMVDPPYYATKGYNGVSLVGMDTYNDTRKLLDRLKSAGNSVIYTDEAWWEKHDKNTGRTIVPPDAGNQVDGLDAFGQLSSIKGLMGDFFRMPIATRMEVVGFIDGNRNAGTIGRSSSADDRQAQRAGQAGENAGGLGTGAGQQAGGGMAKRNDRVSEGQPAKPGRLTPSTGAGKADARNAALTSVVRNGGNSTAVLTDIAKNSTNPAFKLVAKAILAKGLPFDLRIRTDFTDGKVAHYSTDGHFVEFDPGMPLNLEQVLLHEAVHAVTSKYVASFGDSTQLGKELAALFKLAEQHAKKTGAKFYGLTNADEFLAEVMTNADFAQWLDTVPVPLQKSALSRFVRAVARFFGIQKADGATAQAIDVFERIMLAQSDLQSEVSQKLSTSKDAAAVAQAYGVDTEDDGDTVYFGDAEVSLNREDNTYIVTSWNEFKPDHRAAVAWAENNGFASELAKSPSSKLTPVESMLRDALEATGDMGAAKDMAYEALRRQGVAVKWQEVVDAAKKIGRGTRASKAGQS